MNNVSLTITWFFSTNVDNTILKIRNLSTMYKNVKKKINCLSLA